MSNRVHAKSGRSRLPGEADQQATIAMLAANLSHQLRTPLSVIRGRAEHLLRQQSNPAATVTALETIITQVDRIAGILRTVVEYSTRETSRCVCDVRETLASCVDLARARAGAERVAFSLDLGRDPLPVRCDPEQLRQIFLNLIANALAAIAQGSGALRISAESQTGPEPQARIAFEDSAGAVASDLVPRLFDPFFTCGAPRAMDGMGLAVAQSIAREYDGEVGFEPCIDGARFVISLPLATSSD